MRIISGQWRGKNIVAPENLPVRPTTDFAKTGLFNILNNHFHFESVSVLDLFCGTGNISFEFASRGTTKIISVDSNFHCVKFVQSIFEKLNVRSARTIKSDAFVFLERCEQKFDIIFADPPFEMKETEKIPALVFSKKLLNENGWLVVEHQSNRKLETEIEVDEIRKYGNCSFSIFKNKPGDNS